MRASPFKDNPNDSKTLGVLLALLPGLREKLGNPSTWNAAYVEEPASGERYVRLACRDELVLSGPTPRRYVLGLHAFWAGFRGEMHDHRWPLAVLPLARDGNMGVPLYETAWGGVDGTTGVQTVVAGRGWALEDCRVRHAVNSLVDHLSINLSDLTLPARRENRLMTSPVEARLADEVRGLVARALARLLAEWGEVA